MAKPRKMCILIFLAFLGLVLEIVVFCSPYWAVFKFPLQDDGTLMEFGGSLVGKPYDGGEISDDECATISFGLWRVKTCGMFGDEDDDDDDDDEFDHDRKKRGAGWRNKWKRKCHWNGYKDREIEHPEVMPESLKPIKQINRHVGVSAQLGLTEYQVETVIGLAAAVIGFISSVMYTRSGATKSCLGLISCLCLLTSGVLFWTAIGKIQTTITQLRALVILLKMAPIIIPTSWCLVAGGIAATLELIAGTFVMIALSRNNQGENKCHHQTTDMTCAISDQASVPTTSVTEVKGAEQFPYVLPEYEEKMEPPPYVEQMTKAEEASLPADKF